MFGWLSLFVINGIVTFMLTPGEWLSNKRFWDGFFNPSFWPSLSFRTFMALMLAGLFGFITSSFIKESDLRNKMQGYCAKWLIIPFIFLLASAWWYIGSLPEPQKLMILKHSPEIPPFIKAFLLISPLIFTGGILMAMRISAPAKNIVTCCLVVMGLLYMGSFEWIREAGRRPYIIYGDIYSNSIPAKEIDFILNNGVLKNARWAFNREIDDKNQLAAGKEIFRLMCISCHSVGGPVNDIRKSTKKYSIYGMESMLTGMGKINEYMPPFTGSVKEIKALAAYIVREINGKKDEAPPEYSIPALKTKTFPFDSTKDEYVLLGWTGQGMRFFSDNFRYFGLSGPGVTIYAQLIKRGKTPEIVTGNVELTYRIEEGFEEPSSRIDFWKYSRALYGRQINDNEGLSGNKTAGGMDFDENIMSYSASEVPVIPYRKDGAYVPFPVIYIEAKDAKTGRILSQTGITVPASTEIACNNCHGGKWAKNDVTGLSNETALDIIRSHDRSNRTDLEKLVKLGNPQMCSKCHSADQTGSGETDTKQLNLSAAIHGFHANHISKNDPDPCGNCHASSGLSKNYRGIHSNIGLECSNCHGKMEDHALGLLVYEKNKGKKRAEKLMKYLYPRLADSVTQIEPRKPWINQPDCLNCHTGFNPPDTDQSPQNMWTKDIKTLYKMRSDEVGIMCPACHGITHAEYPAANTSGDQRDNYQPVMYQKNRYPIGANRNCAVCHTVEMKEEIHHPNMLAIFRNFY
jgi:mono/diheme cytochrome c family protein